MEEFFEVTNELGDKILCQKLHTFKKNNINYIIYTDFETNEDEDIEILASRFKIENDEMVLYPIENDLEWDLIDIEWEKINHA